MIVAGSVLALLLMGLAVDGFVNPADEEPDDETPDQDEALGGGDQSGGGDGLLDLLNAHEEALQEPEGDKSTGLGLGAGALSYTPLDEIELDEEDDASAAEEADADLLWMTASAAAPAADFVEIDATVEIADGDSVAYVDAFVPATDVLVLEFDGDATDAPKIGVVYDPGEDATFVSANGVPVTMVEGSEDMTADNVRVIMNGEEATPEPQVQPAVTSFEKADTGEDGPQVLPDAEASAKQDTMPDDSAPQVLLTLDQGANDAPDDTSGTSGAYGTDGGDSLVGTVNDDAIAGGDGHDTIFGDDGHDTLIGGAGNDHVHGHTGDDDLQGGDGIDYLNGGGGDDTLDGGGDRDLLFGGDGNDAIFGGAAADFLKGGFGADTLDGGAGDDILDGVFSDGTSDIDDADNLFGGDGDDTIFVGQGDTAIGGDGADTFASGSFIETAEVAGHVADFDPTEDRIEVIFDPEESPDPRLEVLDFADGSGADILLNGQVILSVTGAQGLDPSMIDLQALS